MDARQANLQQILNASAARHSHLCPRQVLGARLALGAGRRLDLDLPRHDKRLLVILETDGCFADGVAVATGATVGHRTLRVEDYGKIAATFVDTLSGEALRLVPHPQSKERAWNYAPGEERPWHAQLFGYQVMPDEELICFEAVSLATPLEKIISQPGVRATCAACGEEINNEREVVRDGVTLCRACTGQAYYRSQG